MQRYFIQFRYTQQGALGVLKEGGSKRRDIVKKGIESVGGKLECFYYTFGEADGIVIAQMPSSAAAAALSLQVAASGVASIRTTVIVEPDEVDDAAQTKVKYRGTK